LVFTRTWHLPQTASGPFQPNSVGGGSESTVLQVQIFMIRPSKKAAWIPFESCFNPSEHRTSSSGWFKRESNGLYL